MIRNLFQWIVYSSKDPTKFSLTLKGIVTTVVSIIATLGFYFGLRVFPQGQIVDLLGELIDDIGTIIATIGSIISIFGALRKIWLTILGENHQNPL